MNFDRMRALLLDQAIRGELVPQLAEEGVVEIGAIAPEAFKLPKTWKWLTLKSLVIPTKQIIPEESFTYLDVSSIKNFQIDEIKRLDPSNAPSRARKVVQPGMVLFATVRPYLKNICVSPELPGQVIASTAFATMTCSKDLNNRYLFYFLRSDFFTDLVKSKQRGISYPAISEKDFYALPVPVPPLDEQIRIVAKLEEAFAEIDRAEKAYQELQTLSGVLRGQILQKAIQGKLVPQLDSEEEVQQIGDAPEDVPFTIPEKWKWVTLLSLGTTYTGTTPSTSKKEYFGKDIPFVKPGDIDRYLLTYREDGLSSVARDVARLVPKNSLLMVCIGGSIGKVAICDREVSFNQQINAIVSDEESVLSRYLFVVMRSAYFQDEVWGNATGTATPIINKSRWGKILIPLPPIKEQARIVAKVDDLLKHVEALSAK